MELLLKLDNRAILVYFVETRVDFKAIWEDAFEMLTSGHVHVNVTSVFVFHQFPPAFIG